MISIHAPLWPNKADPYLAHFSDQERERYIAATESLAQAKKEMAGLDQSTANYARLAKICDDAQDIFWPIRYSAQARVNRGESQPVLEPEDKPFSSAALRQENELLKIEAEEFRRTNAALKAEIAHLENLE